MNKRILLIDPTSIHHGPPEGIKESDTFINKHYVEKVNEVVDSICPDNNGNALKGRYITNYGLLMLSSLLKKKGYEVDYINGDYFDNSDEYLKYIESIINKYDLVSMTSVTPQFCEVKKIAQRIKDLNNNMPIVVGGPHTRYFLNHDTEDCFNCTFIGYGIDKSADTIEKILNGEPYDNKVITTEYFDVEKDFGVIPKDKIGNTMLYSYINFGCPNDCKYCVEHKFVDKMCFNSIDEKFKEISELVNEHGVKLIHIADSDFLIHKPTVINFIRYVREKNLHFCFSINTSPLTINRWGENDLLKELKEIGLVEILIGAEHFSKKVQSSMAKDYDIDIFATNLDYLKHDVNIPVISLYTLVGFPGEYEEDIEENLRVIRKFKDNDLFDYTFPKFFVPYPDSDIYLHPEKYHVKIKNENWEEYQRWQLPRPIEIIGMSDQQYVDEIMQINKIVMEDKEYENSSSTSFCKKRRQDTNGTRK